LKPWQKRQWCIPKVGAEFVAAMEDVLTVYARPYDRRYPQVCLDEKIKYLLDSPSPNLPMRGAIDDKPGSCEKEDYEYERRGSANLFVMVEPKAGYRHVMVTERRTSKDYAYALKWLVDEGYPDCEKIILVDDNLNTHSPASLYKVFAPAEARRILDKFEFHHTPKHGSWLNMAEIEIGIFERQCLARRMGSQIFLEQEVAALEAERNRAEAKINWQFTCEMARSKLHRLYPKLEAAETAASIV
jgi:hypothetical protein